MKKIVTAAVLIFSSLFGPQLLAASPVSATLMLPHDKVLPGVPFDLVVTYTNVSDKPLSIKGGLATLVVTFANGDTVVMHKPDVNDRWGAVFAVPARLAPGESVQQALAWDHGSIPNWFRYPSFSGPGQYGVAIELQATDEEETVLGTLRTAAVTLTRVEPVGIDAELWKRMQEISSGEWSDSSFVATKSGSALAGEIIQLHPSSGYYPYVVALRAFQSKDKSRIPVLLEAAERFSSSPAYPYLLKSAAECALYEAWKARDEGDAVAAQKYFSLAQALFRDAIATKSMAIRESAEEGLRHVAHGLERLTNKHAR
jgi:hypothetical protein